MCCILACYSRRPTMKLLSDIASTNQDGLGVAWIDRSNGMVRWVKGLKEAKVFEITETIELPFMVHARWATVGGNGPRLTHPFPVENKPSLALVGAAKQVLMHNGHVGEWETLAKTIGLKLPPRPFGWSDSRVIAAAVHLVGKEILEALTPNRFALLSVDGGLEMFGEWNKEEEGLYASSSTRPAGYCWAGSAGYSWYRDDDSGAIIRIGGSYPKKYDSESLQDALRAEDAKSWDMTEEEYEISRAKLRNREKRLHEMDDEWWNRHQSGSDGGGE